MSVTWNPADKAATVNLSGGDLTCAAAAACNKDSVRATHSVSSGKYYWEVKIDALHVGHTTGVGKSSSVITSEVGTCSGGASYGYRYTGQKRHGEQLVGYGDSYTTDDIVGVALDLDNGKIWWSKNGVWQASGNPAAGTNPAFTGLSGTFFPMHTVWGQSGGADEATARFLVGSFSYSAPSGFSSFEAGPLTGTNLLDGKLIVKNDAASLLDGRAVVDIFAANTFDGKATVKDSNVILFNGKAEVTGWKADLLDGKAEVTGWKADLLDGKINATNFATNLFNGKAQVYTRTSNLLDGKINLQGETTNLLDGKARVEVGITTVFFDGKAMVQSETTALLDGKLLIDSVVSIDATAPTPTANFEVGKRIEGKCPVPSFTCNALPGRDSSLIATVSTPTCSMRIGLALDADAPVPTCVIVADTHHLATLYGNVPVPTCGMLADTENIVVINAIVPCPRGLFVATVGNVADIYGKVPCPAGSMQALTGFVVSLNGKVPVPGSLVRFYASSANVSITLEGNVPVSTMLSFVRCSLPSLILRHERGEIR